MISHSSTLAWKIPWTKGAWQVTVHGVAKSWTQLSDFIFTDSSVDKEPTCNAGDPDSTPGSRKSPGEGIGYPLQYFWTSLVAQLVKNPPAMWETWVRSLGWEDPLEKGKATHSSISAWRIPWTGSILAWKILPTEESCYVSWDCTELDMTE